jgi:hypothetical protein
MALLAHTSEHNFAARLSFGVLFIPFTGARNPAIANQLAEALKRDQGKPVKSLHTDPHEKTETCWLHANTWCFSTLEPAQIEPAN